METINTNENDLKLKSILESVLFVHGNPIKRTTLLDLLEINKKKLLQIINELKNDYLSEERGIKLIEIEDSYQLVTKEQNSDLLNKHIVDKKKQVLSQAAIECLCIIAYKQPITKVEIEDIRGVQCDKSISKLIERKLIEEVGRLDSIGRPILYGTTAEFLKQFSFSSLNELPSLSIFEQ